MSDALIDVSWRGLEVGRRILLREVTDDRGRVNVALPMPVGSAVVLRAGALEIPASVARVFEQTTGGAETPGMLLVPVLEGEAREWWTARAAESAAAAAAGPVADAEGDDEGAAVIVAPAASRPTMVFQAATPAQIAAALASATPTPTRSPAMAPAVSQSPTLTPAQIAAAMASAQEKPAPPLATSAAIAATAEEHAHLHVSAEPMDDADASRTAVMHGMPPDEPPEDTSRTAIMNAVDIEAIIAEGTSGGGNGDADDSGTVEAVGSETSNGTSDSGPGGKRKAAAKGKRRKGR